MCTLKVIGKRFGCMHGSSANTERVFSGLNSFITAERNRLGVSLVSDMMVFKIHRQSTTEAISRSRSRLSAKKLRQEQTQRDEWTQSSQLELDEEENQEDSNGASLMDPDLLRNCDDLQDFASIFDSALYSYFSDWIDFTSRPLENYEESAASSSQSRRTSDERAKALFDAIERQKQ